MMKDLIAERYARALLDVVMAEDIEEKVTKDFSEFIQMLKDSRDFDYLLTDPSFSPVKRRNVLETVMEKSSISHVLGRFLFLLVDKGRMFLIEDIFNSYINMIDKRKGIEVAKMYCAVEPEKKSIENIKKQLQRISGKDVKLDVSADPSLIAGIRIIMGGKVFDGSLKNKLDMLKSQLVRE